MPCSGPRYLPAAISLSATAAAFNALSFRTVTYDSSLGSIAAMRSSIIWVSALDENDLSDIRAPASAMLNFHALDSWLTCAPRKRRQAEPPARGPKLFDKRLREYRSAWTQWCGCCPASI